jgi:UPF0755 protein
MTFSKNILLYVFCLIAILFLGYFLFFSSPASFPEGNIINVKGGTSIRGLSFQLKQEHIIRSRIAFEAFIIIYNGERHAIQGDYLFADKLPIFEVARRISKGEHHLPPVKITIPEGFTLDQIAEAFSVKLSNFNKDKFLLEAKNQEVYLFPDTYFFLSTDNEEAVLSYMRENFEKKIQPILPEIALFGKSEREVIIMASLVEREAKGDTDRGFISGILWKRLKIGMPLQVDAAPSTYKTKGLPDSPISNPGLEAIKATIYPENSPYLYYLHDKDGIIHYARSFEEHKANKLKYLK